MHYSLFHSVSDAVRWFQENAPQPTQNGSAYALLTPIYPSLVGHFASPLLSCEGRRV